MSKSNNNNHFKAGLFILVSFSVATAIFFALTGSALLNGPMHDFTVRFDLGEDVSGIQPGSEVRLGGFKIGSVRDIDVIADGKSEPHVNVIIRTPERYKLKEDAVIAVQAGLTGNVNLNIASLGGGADATRDFPLKGKPDALTSAIAGFSGVGEGVTSTLADLRPRVLAAIDQIKTTAASADETIKQVKAKIDPAYEKYAAIADPAHGVMTNLNDILGDTKGDIRKSIANLSASLTTIKERLPTVMDKVADNLDALRTQLDKTGTILDDAKAIAANTKDATGSARAILNNNRARIDDITKSLSFTSQNLAAASSEIRHAPWRLLYKPTDGEVANQNLYDAARQFADASRKLKDSAQALRDTAADPKSQTTDVKTVLDRLNADFESYQKVETTLWDRVQK